MSEAVSENVALIRRGFALWNAALDKTDATRASAALDEMLMQYSPDAEIDFSRLTPDLQPQKGPPALITTRRWLEEAREVFVSGCYEPLGFTEVDDYVIVPTRLSAQGVSGAGSSLEFVYVFRVRDGLIDFAASFSSLAEARESIPARKERE
jgi:ketosteroid isomerase-like protein